MSEIAQTNQKEPPSLAAAYWIYGVAANIAFGITHGRHIEYEGRLTDVTELCFQQFYDLRTFLISRGVVTHQGAQADGHAFGVPAA